mgnify:FL=1
MLIQTEGGSHFYGYRGSKSRGTSGPHPKLDERQENLELSCEYYLDRGQPIGREYGDFLFLRCHSNRFVHDSFYKI